MELLTVIIIIGILVAVAMPIYANVTHNARVQANKANLRIIEGAVHAYLADNPGKSLSGLNIDRTGGVLVPDYIKEWPDNPLSEGKKYIIENGVVKEES